MLSVVHNQCHVCWCSGDFRSQSINRNGTDPQSYNIPSPAWEELMYLDLIMANILQTWETWRTMSYEMAKAELCYILVPAECLEPNDARPSADIALTTMSDMRSFLWSFFAYTWYWFWFLYIFAGQIISIRKTDDMKSTWKYFSCYWPFVRGIHQ